jgi:Zn finger protein HypA/HybF involved in hydrogenase expression
MGWGNSNNDKELHCRQCGQFLDSRELKDGNCPECNSRAVGYNNGTHECFNCEHEW